MEERTPYRVTPAVEPPRLPADTLLEADNPGYRQPTPNEVRLLARLCFRPDGTSYSGSDVARLVGVSPRKVRLWMSDEGEDLRPIPYAAWRLMLIAAGLVPAPDARRPGAGGE